MPSEFDYPKILKYWKKNFNCTGSIVTEEGGTEYFKLTGNQAEAISSFLKEEGIALPENIKIHGV